MAVHFDFDSRPMGPGDIRGLTLTSATPAHVHIRCFVNARRRVVYRPCAECGSYPIQQGQTIQIQASEAVFSRVNGNLEITVTDLNGDTERVRVRVTMTDPDAASIAVAVAE